MYSSRGFAALANHSQVESSSRLTIDSMSQQIRQSKGRLAFSTGIEALTQINSQDS